MKKKEVGKNTSLNTEEILDKVVEIEPVDKKHDNKDNRNISRKRKQTALKTKDRIKEMASRGLLKLNLETKKPPKHGWNWEEFNVMIENESNITERMLNKEAQENPFSLFPEYGINRSTSDENTSDWNAGVFPTLGMFENFIG